VGFAILGALILSLTYIPMMCALFLPKKINHNKNFSDKMMDFFQRIYQPLLQKAIQFKYWLVGITVSLFVVSLIIF
jgi:cobalt-zinc-cadmium resistance protein CzcA